MKTFFHKFAESLWKTLSKCQISAHSYFSVMKKDAYIEIGVSEKVDEAEAVVILRLSFPRDGFLFDRNWHANVPRTSADNLNKISQLKKYK